MVGSSSSGSLSMKTIDEALELFERVAITIAMWASERVVHKKVPGVYEVDTYTALSAKIDSLVHKIENMSQSTNAVQAKRASCEECGTDHSTVNCTILIQGTEQVDFIQRGQCQQNNPYSDTYNPCWRKRPNISWSNQNPTAPHGSQFQQAEKRISLEEMFGKFMEKTDQYMDVNNQFMRKIETTLQNQSAAIKNLETQMGQMAQALSGREHVKAITTRSGVQLPEFHVKRPTVNKEKVPSTDEEHAEQTEQTTDTSIKESSNTPQVKATAPIKPYEPLIPFPQRLQKHKLDKQYIKFLEVFKELHINIPFADALVQMPSYAKFLKDILSNKRKLDEHETVMLTEECSASIKKMLPPKLKDPGSFTVLCPSINLMPLSMFRILGLGEVKATTVTLQLADRSITHPR
ncbi:uncharacterized protein LOC111404443 [Olea europaea var. sylvestris]|uniref:uncharacterized protein LOC111404443 n=1 Tax=Olea europaea var. sylvestris TaxID=158386 RepID=UPI000C1D2AE6|nr:uncharacterized protein LOC111404443 [Olea europaea var. sylvestris]